MLDASGQVRWRWMGEPFGASAAEEQPTASLAAVQQNLRFPGQQYEAFGGRFYNHFRDYDPTTGRYVQSDPIGLSAGINTYEYVGGNPLAYSDPTGECPWCIGIAIGAGTDLAMQLLANGGKLKCVNVGQVLSSAALGALGGGIGARGLTSFLNRLPIGRVGQSALKLTKKNIGENLSLVENRLKGRRLIATERATIPGLFTKVDSTWRTLTGRIKYVESKFGTSPLSDAQRLAAATEPNYVVERWSYEFFSRIGAYFGGATGTILGNPGGDGDCECSQ